jgi:prevent-host-death family protein
MTTTFINTVEAKEDFSELIHRVSHHKERVVLTRRGNEIAAIVPLEDLQLLRHLQNQTDLHGALEALKEARSHGTFSLEDLKKQLDKQ